MTPPSNILPEVEPSADLSEPTPPRPPRRARLGIPLDAAVTAQPDGYEILSAAELEAISQATQ